MSAAFRVGWFTRRSRGFLAGCLRLGCGTTLGRNRLANRARSAELLGSASISLKSEFRSANGEEKPRSFTPGFAAHLMASPISLFFVRSRPS
jgi:hypothetical protein